MKKIFTTLALIGAIVTGAVAQKTADLQIIPYFPQPNATYNNLNNGDTFYIAAIVKNNGSSAVVASDTLSISLNGCFNGVTTGNMYSLSVEEHMNLPVGASDTVVYPVIQGSIVGSTSTEQVKAQWNTNAKDTVAISIFGFNQAGLFNDVGVDNANGQFTSGSNNVAVYTVTFGIPTSITDAKAFKKEALNVYPNPAVNEVNFNYAFSNSADATVKVMDVTGREVLTQSFGKQVAGQQSFKVDVSGLQNGMYTIEFITDNTKAISKFNITK